MSIETLSTSEDPSMRAMLLELMLWDGIMWFALLPVFYLCIYLVWTRVRAPQVACDSSSPDITARPR